MKSKAEQLKIFIDSIIDKKVKTITYVFYNKKNNLYKIGRTTNLLQRHKRIEEINFCKLDIVRTWNKDIENFLHKKYKKFRIEGEWFNLPKNILFEIISIL